MENNKKLKNKADKNRKSRLAGTITEKIISNSFNASAWIFCLLVDAGEMTIEAFLNPSYYADLPDNHSKLFENKSLPKKKTEFKKSAIRQSIWRLKKLGFVEKKEGKFSLTLAGKILAKYIINRKKVLNKKWDGKYRVVIFDIPEKQKETRNWLRKELYLLNYRKLQMSVFISKYSLTEDLIREIKRRRISNCVNYLLVDRVYKNIF
jgi:CRISPR-associated endonuclease Cas2